MELTKANVKTPFVIADTSYDSSHTAMWLVRIDESCRWLALACSESWDFLSGDLPHPPSPIPPSYLDPESWS